MKNTIVSRGKLSREEGEVKNVESVVREEEQRFVDDVRWRKFGESEE